MKNVIVVISQRRYNGCNKLSLHPVQVFTGEGHEGCLYRMYRHQATLFSKQQFPSTWFRFLMFVFTLGWKWPRICRWICDWECFWMVYIDFGVRACVWAASRDHFPSMSRLYDLLFTLQSISTRQSQLGCWQCCLTIKVIYLSCWWTREKRGEAAKGHYGNLKK